MSTEPASPADFVRAYLTAIESDQLVGNEESWYTPDALQIEWPNKLMPEGATRNLEAIRAAGRRGQAIVDRQKYEISGLVAQDNLVAVEAIFRARFKFDLPDLQKGAVMEARFAMFFEMKDGRIYRHRSYDCFTKPEIVE